MGQEAITTEVFGCLHRQSSRLEDRGRRRPLFTTHGPVASYLSEETADTHDDTRLGPQEGAEEQSTDIDGYDAALHAGREKIYSSFYTLFQAHQDADGLPEFATNESESSVSYGAGTPFTETSNTNDDACHDGFTVEDHELDCYVEDTGNYRAVAVNRYAGLYSDQFIPTSPYQHQEYSRPPHMTERDHFFTFGCDNRSGSVFERKFGIRSSRNTATSSRNTDVDHSLNYPSRPILRCPRNASPPPIHDHPRSPPPGEPAQSKDSRPTPKYMHRAISLSRITQGLQRGLQSATSFPPQGNPGPRPLNP